MNDVAVLPVSTPPLGSRASGAPPRDWLHRATVAAWAVVTSALLVAAVSPFEIPLQWLSVGSFTVTTLEMALLAAFTAGGYAFVRHPDAVRFRTPITVPIAAVLAVVLIASLAAPEFQANSLRFWGRLVAAGVLFFLTVNVINSRRQAGRLIAVLLAAGSIVGALAVLELAQVPWVMDALKVFRPGFHVVGGQVRASSTLGYPTITSMYLEVVFALGLFWLRSGALPFAALTLVGAGVIATFTRAGLITMTLSLLVMTCAVWLRHGWHRDHVRIAALAGVLIALVLLSRSPQMLMTRMSVEGSQDWYGAEYRVPSTLTLRAGSFNEIPVGLSNRGWITWQSRQLPVFSLSYHWLSVDTEEVLMFDGLRTDFQQSVEPGDDVDVLARVRAPGHPGTYLLVWDVVHEYRTWLSLEGVFPGRTVVTVEGEAVEAALTPRGRMPSVTMRMPRMVLWKTAGEVARERPLLGVGPDNFRLVYGRYLGLSAWDTRVHTNNTYLESLAGMGIAGAVVVAWLAAATFLAIWKLWRTVPLEAVWLCAAAAAACLAIAVHGLVDSFFAFTPTYVVFALAAGIMFSRALGDPLDHPTAHSPRGGGPESSGA